MKYSEFLKKVTICPFCRENSSETVIYQNDLAYLTYSRAPYHMDHLLIIPNRHFEKISDITIDEMAAIDEIQKKALAMIAKIGHKNVTILVREGPQSGRTVNHIHYHVVPEVIIGDINHAKEDRDVLNDENLAKSIERFKNLL